MTEKSDAEAQRLKQAQALIDAFTREHRRPPRDVEELEAWAAARAR